MAKITVYEALMDVSNVLISQDSEWIAKNKDMLDAFKDICIRNYNNGVVNPEQFFNLTRCIPGFEC